MNDLRYPVGPETIPDSSTPEDRAAWIAQVAATPGELRAAVDGLGARQLETHYREGGWTVRQVVHHMADSHIHAYIRTKFALTTTEPTIMPYDEALWAALIDASTVDLGASLALLTGLHERWVQLWRSLTPGQWQRKFLHPERGAVRLDQQLAAYAWHGRHHVAHIMALRARMGWR